MCVFCVNVISMLVLYCLETAIIVVSCLPQDGDVFGGADRCPALLPQQGRATSCHSR